MNKTVMAVFAAGALALLAAPLRAEAQDCDSLVVDPAGLLKGGAGRVAAAANSLVAQGAMVRVRVLNDLAGQPDGAHWMAAVTQACPGWQSTGGGRKSSLLVVLVAPKQRKSGIYYGSLWKPAFTGHREHRVQVQAMNPHFRDGDIAAGLVAGLNELAALLTAYQNRPRGTGGGNTTVIQEKPTDLTGLWWVLAGLLGLAALSGLTYLLWRRKRYRDLCSACQLRAQKNQAAASSRIFENNEALKRTEEEIGQLTDRLDPQDQELLAIRSRLAGAKGDHAAATIRYSDLTNSAVQPDTAGLALEQYRTLEEAYAEALTQLQQNAMAIETCREAVRDKHEQAGRQTPR